MDERRSGRFLLALAASIKESNDDSKNFTFEGLSVAVVGLVCIVCVMLMCACMESKQKQNAPAGDLRQTSEKRERKSGVLIKENGTDIEIKTGATATANGGKAPTTAMLPSFTPPAARSTNTRVLPAPPISDHNVHSKILAGTEHYSSAVISPDESHHAIQHYSSSKNAGKVQLEPHNDLYDHLGLKPSVKPSDYDSLGELKRPERKILKTKVSGGSDDDDYSELDDKTYPVIINVSTVRTESSDSYSKVKEVDDFKSAYYSQAKEEDVYNNIGESGETVPASLRHNLKQSLEQDNPYDFVQDDSAGEFKDVLKAERVAGGIEFNRINPPISNNLHNSSALLHENGENGEEYAVVHKTKSRIMNAEEIDEFTSKERSCSNASAGPPPEPPRLYSVSDSLEAISATGTSPKTSKKHNYSIVTARESLASITERKKRNLYQKAADTEDNTYTMVDGWSEDGDEMGGCNLVNNTYYEIAISGEGACPSLVKKALSSEQINNRSNIPPKSSSSVDSLSPVAKYTASNSGYVQRNHLTSLADEGNDRLNQWMDAHEYDNSAGSYVTLKTDSYPPTFGWDESRDVSLVANNLAVVDCVQNNKVTEIMDDYPDYESVDAKIIHPADLKFVDNVFESSVDSSGNKKVGQRRRKLD